jgi:hypothetical protein
MVHKYENMEFLLALVEFTNDAVVKDFGIKESAAGWSKLKIVYVHCIKKVSGYSARGITSLDLMEIPYNYLQKDS